MPTLSGLPSRQYFTILSSNLGCVGANKISDYAGLVKISPGQRARMCSLMELHKQTVIWLVTGRRLKEEKKWYMRRKRLSYESWFKSLDAEEPLPIVTKAGPQKIIYWPSGRGGRVSMWWRPPHAGAYFRVIATVSIILWMTLVTYLYP